MIFKKADDGYARESLAHFLEFLGDAAAFVAGAPLALSVVKQVLVYLKKGEWVTFSGIDALAMVFKDSPWLHSPQDWIGVHQFLGWVHGGIFATVILMILYVPTLLLIELAKDKVSRNA